MATRHTLFKLNIRKHLWKGDLIVKKELPKLENFLEELQKNWKAVKKLMKITKKTMKKQFNKKNDETYKN